MSNKTINNILQISEGVIRLGSNTLLELRNSSDHTKPYPVITNYVNNKQKKKRYMEHLLHTGTVSKIVENYPALPTTHRKN